MPAGYLSGDCHQDVIQATIDDGIAFARAQIAKGKSSPICLSCKHPIPIERQEASKGCIYCIDCQDKKDSKISSGYNRRAGHDSQLR